MLTKLGSLTNQDVFVPLVMLLLIYVTKNSNICRKAPESTSELPPLRMDLPSSPC